jgi:hypothetical protein
MAIILLHPSDTELNAINARRDQLETQILTNATLDNVERNASIFVISPPRFGSDSGLRKQTKLESMPQARRPVFDVLGRHQTRKWPR